MAMSRAMTRRPILDGACLGGVSSTRCLAATRLTSGMGVAPWDPVDDDDRGFAARSPALPPQVDIASAAQSGTHGDLQPAASEVHDFPLARVAAPGLGRD